MPLLFDLDPLTCCQTDHVLDGLYKALGEQPEADIWQPHHDPWQRDHIEAVTQRGLARLDAIRDALMMALPEEPMHKADAPWLRWSQADFDRVRALQTFRSTGAGCLRLWRQTEQRRQCRTALH